VQTPSRWRHLPRVVMFFCLVGTLIGSAAPGAPAAPLAACAPRPAVGVAVVPGGAGALQVTITATTNGSTPTNQLTRLQFGAASGALIDVPGQPAGQPGSFTVVLAASTTQTSFTVRQAVAGQAATVPLTVTDSCGDWPTLVGGGPNAFPTATPDTGGASPTPTATPSVAATPTRTATITRTPTATRTATPTRPTSLRASQGSLLAGGAQGASWSDVASPTLFDWIGLFRPGAADRDYVASPRFTGATAPNGATTLVIPPAAAAGAYELRLFSDKSTTRLAISNGFTVSRPTATAIPTPTPGTPPPLVVAPAAAVGTGGQHTSLQIDRNRDASTLGALDVPVVSYYDPATGTLRVLRCGSKDCSTGNTTQAIGPGGHYSSLQLDNRVDPSFVPPPGTPPNRLNHPVVSYHDPLAQTLKVVRCNDLACAGRTVATLDSGGVGQFTSLALDASGNPVVSYYDAANGDLKVLHCANPDCTGGGHSIVPVDTAGNVGQYTSLALDDSGRPVVSYYDVSNQALKLLHCGNANCTAGNSVVPVDAIGNVGQHTSLALDVLGNPVISYYDATNQRLKVAHCGDPLCADLASIAAPDAGGNVGQFTALRLDQLGRPVISYYDAALGRLKVLRCGDVACLAGNSITVAAAGNVGQFAALALDTTDNPALSYHDASVGGALKVQRCSSATCATTPDAVGDVGQYTALAVAGGNPTVSYYDATLHRLGVLRCGNADCSAPLGPAAPTPCPSGYNCLNRLPDYAHADSGRGSALTLDSGGVPVVSYVGASSAGSNGDLSILHCGDIACRSGNVITNPDSSGRVGPHTAITLDGAGNPVVSYYDAVNGDLKVLHCVNDQCGGGVSFAPTCPVTNNCIATVDTAGNVGQYNSLRLDSRGWPVVSYYDATNGDLKVLRCGDPYCGSGNIIATPDSAGNVGQYTSLALDASDRPVVSYYDVTNGHLKVLHCVTVDCSGSGHSIATPDTSGNVGQYTSLVLDGAGNPVVSYYDVANGDLKVLRCGDPNCSAGNVVVAADTIGNVGRYTAVALSGGNPVVGYYDVTNGDVKVLRCLSPSCN